MQGEKYIYSTLFVKINWTVNDVPTLDRSPTSGKLEKKSKQKVRVMKMEEASRSGTSIESASSTHSTLVDPETVRMERRNSSNSGVELERIYEVNETKEK